MVDDYRLTDEYRADLVRLLKRIEAEGLKRPKRSLE